MTDIANELLPRFEDQFNTPEVGKPFQEAYDLETLQPTEEWLEIYQRVKAEAIDLGIPLDQD